MSDRKGDRSEKHVPFGERQPPPPKQPGPNQKKGEVQPPPVKKPPKKEN